MLPSAPVEDVLPVASEDALDLVEDVLPLVEDVLPSAPAEDVLPVASEDDLVQQVKVDFSPAKVSFKSSPLVASLFFLPFFWYFCSMGSPVEAFTAFDCQNRSNRVTAYSLIEPESCHGHVADLRYVRVLSAEIIQVKKTRIVPVFRCLAIESEF